MIAISKLGRARQGKGLNAVAFAALLRERGITEATPHRVYRIENGLTKPTEQERALIAELLGVPTYEVPR